MSPGPIDVTGMMTSIIENPLMAVPPGALKPASPMILLIQVIPPCLFQVRYCIWFGRTIALMMGKCTIAAL